MGEDQDKTEEERFEAGLRQILDSGSYDRKTSAGSQPGRSDWRPEDRARWTAGMAEAEPKGLFWLKLMRPLALLALLALFVKFVTRITAAH